jgi:hypothetical protein
MRRERIGERQRPRNTIPLTPELQAQLEKLEVFAQEHGQTVAGALQDAVTTYLEAQDAAFEQDVAATQRGYDDVRAGRTLSLEDFDSICAGSMTFRVELSEAA